MNSWCHIGYIKYNKVNFDYFKNILIGWFELFRTPKTGVTALVVGGAQEALEHDSQNVPIVLRHRKGNILLLLFYEINNESKFYDHFNSILKMKFSNDS